MCFSPISRVLPTRLLLACLLAKPLRSTVGTKEAYKTKTGSTSSVIPSPNPTPIPNPNQNSTLGSSWWGKEHGLGDFKDK